MNLAPSIHSEHQTRKCQSIEHNTTGEMCYNALTFDQHLANQQLADEVFFLA